MIRRFAAVFLFSALTVTTMAHADAKTQNKPFEVVQNDLLKRAPLGTDYFMGKANAPVTLVEYASFTCSHCAEFHRDVLPTLQKNYIDTGKMTYVLRSFIRNGVDLKATMLLDCVGEDGGKDRYYTFARVLLESQQKWAGDASFNALKTFAKVGGVSEQRFDACMADSAREVKILKRQKQAMDELKVDRTPYVFINSMRFDNPPTVEHISAYVDKLIGKGAKANAETKPAEAAASEAEKPSKKASSSGTDTERTHSSEGYAAPGWK